MKELAKQYKKQPIIGYTCADYGDNIISSPNKTRANLIETAVIEVNKFYESTVSSKNERTMYFHPNGQSQMILKRFKDGKEVTLEYLRGLVIKAAEDRGVNFEQVLKVGGWSC